MATDGIKFCTGCGQTLQEGLRFCVHCGAAVIREEPDHPSAEEQSPPYQSPRPGAEDGIAASAAPFVDRRPADAPPSKPPKKKLSTAARIGLILSVVIVAVAGAAVFHYTWGQGNTPLTAAEILSLGEKYLLMLDYEQAVVYFEQLVEIEPKNPRGYTGAAEAYAALGDTESAVAILRRGLEQLPEDAGIRALLASLPGTESPPDAAATGTIQIVAVTPETVTPGTETEFIVTVSYTSSRAEGCIIYAGANILESDSYRLLEEYVLPDISGFYTFRFICTPVPWSDEPFGIYVNMSEYPHADRWTPLDADVYPLSPDAATSGRNNYAYLLDAVAPYEKERCAFNAGNMGGETYGHGFIFTDSWAIGDPYLIFNLDGQYAKLTGIIGHVDGSTRVDRTVKFYGDDVLIHSVYVGYEKLPEEFSIDLSGVKKFKIMCNGARWHTNMCTGLFELILS
jgi:tetratricopeptide (TPR) repeat protein